MENLKEFEKKPSYTSEDIDDFLKDVKNRRQREEDGSEGKKINTKRIKFEQPFFNEKRIQSLITLSGQELISEVEIFNNNFQCDISLGRIENLINVPVSLKETQIRVCMELLFLYEQLLKIFSQHVKAIPNDLGILEKTDFVIKSIKYDSTKACLYVIRKYCYTNYLLNSIDINLLEKFIFNCREVVKMMEKVIVYPRFYCEGIQENCDKLSKFQSYKTKLCRNYRNSGWCSLGNDCHFAHGPNDNQAYKTKLCRYYRDNGWCSLGNDCHFAHGANELKYNN